MMSDRQTVHWEILGYDSFSDQLVWSVPVPVTLNAEAEFLAGVPAIGDRTGEFPLSDGAARQLARRIHCKIPPAASEFTMQALDQ